MRGYFAPVAKMASLCVLFAIAAEEDLEREVVTVYFKRILEEEVYIMLPNDIDDAVAPDGYVYQLRKALYGLKEAGMLWYATMDEKLVLPRSWGIIAFTRDSTISKAAKYISVCMSTI